MDRSKRPGTRHGRHSANRDSIHADEEFYATNEINLLVDTVSNQPMNAPAPPPVHRIHQNRRNRSNLPKDSLQSLHSQNKPYHNHKKKSKNESLQLAKERQSKNGRQSYSNGHYASDGGTKRDYVSSSRGRIYQEEEVFVEKRQRTLSVYPSPNLSGYPEADYMNQRIPRKSSSASSSAPIQHSSSSPPDHRYQIEDEENYNSDERKQRKSSSTILDETLASISRSSTKFEAGKVLDLCDGENSDTETSHAAVAKQSSSSSFAIHSSQCSSSSSSDRSMCNSPARRPETSSTISSQKPPPVACIEVPDDEEEEDPRNTTTTPHVDALYMDVVGQIERESVVPASHSSFSQSPSILRQVGSAVASVGTSCSKFFISKVNGGPPPSTKPQTQENFFNRAHRAARERRSGHPIAVGATIFQGAADKNEELQTFSSDDEKWQLQRPRKNSRGHIKDDDDDEDYQPTPEKKKKEAPPSRKALKQTKLKGVRKSARNRPGQVIEIGSSSEDESLQEPTLPEPRKSQDPISVVLSPQLMSIGRNVFHQVHVELLISPRDDDECKLYLSYQNESRGRTLRSRKVSSEKAVEERSHVISMGADVREVKYFLYNHHGQQEQEDEKERFKYCFCAMNVKHNTENGLSMYSNSYKPDSDIDMLRNIILVFSFEDDLNRIISAFRENALFECLVTEDSRLSTAEALDFCRAIRDDQALEHHEAKAKFLVGKDPDEVLLLYPFGDSSMSPLIDEAAKGLVELSCVLNRENMAGNVATRNGEPKIEKNVATKNVVVEPKIEKNGAEKDDGLGEESRAVLAFSVSTMERLEPGVYLNDTLIDFWLQWIWRNCDKSDIHYFTTLFYTTLEKEGTNGVARWTEKRGVDIFTKKFVFIPINKHLHWSLCVVINPGAIVDHVKMLDDHDKDVSNLSLDDDPFPCLLFFDSLKAHAKERVGRLVRTWLNAEWKRLNPSHAMDAPFSAKAMRICSPKVPYQINSWDCGVYVCRYAYGMYMLRTRRFTYAEVEYFDDAPDPKFRTLISEDIAFGFDADAIRRIREEYFTLLERLHVLYRKWKECDDRKRIEARRAKKVEADVGPCNVPKESIEEEEDVTVKQYPFAGTPEYSRRAKKVEADVGPCNEPKESIEEEDDVTVKQYPFAGTSEYEIL